VTWPPWRDELIATGGEINLRVMREDLIDG